MKHDTDTTGVLALIAGGIAALAAVVLTAVRFGSLNGGGTVAQWHAVCSSQLGQIAQISPRVASDCGWAGFGEGVKGWAWALGIIGLAFGIWKISRPVPGDPKL